MASLMLELDQISNAINLIKMPNGSKAYPALSCCDLKKDYPETKTGLFYKVNDNENKVYCIIIYCRCLLY